MVLLYALAAVVFVNCVYFYIFSKFSYLKISEKVSSEELPISLIVCAKNEEENLQKNIPLWLAQKHKNFELILINDASSDETLEIMEAFALKDERITIVNVENNEAFWGNKKYALTLGIKRAKNKRMLFTDADCTPASNNWLKEMTSHITDEKQIVLGYGAYNKQPGLLNSLIRFETAMTAIQYFSYAETGIPYMGVGRNLSYTSELYYDNNGFMSHIKVPSGDDDLFVNQAATKENIAICIDENAFTYSNPKTTWKSWKIQKKRHITTAKFYKPFHKFLLGLYYVSNILFWVLAFASILFLDWKIPVALIAFRLLIQYIIIGKGLLRLKEKSVIYFLPVYELFLVLAQMSIFISNKTSKTSRWK